MDNGLKDMIMLLNGFSETLLEDAKKNNAEQISWNFADFMDYAAKTADVIPMIDINYIAAYGLYDEIRLNDRLKEINREKAEKLADIIEKDQLVSGEKRDITEQVVFGSKNSFDIALELDTEIERE